MTELMKPSIGSVGNKMTTVHLHDDGTASLVHDGCFPVLIPGDAVVRLLLHGRWTRKEGVVPDYVTVQEQEGGGDE